MKGWVIYSFVVTVIASGALGVGVGYVLFDSDDDDARVVQATEEPTETVTLQPGPTNYAPRLNGPEAATLVESVLTNSFGGLGLESPPDWVCWPKGFNEDERAWPITCIAGIGGEIFTLYHLVDDASGEITPLN